MYSSKPENLKEINKFLYSVKPPKLNQEINNLKQIKKQMRRLNRNKNPSSLKKNVRE